MSPTSRAQATACCRHAVLIAAILALPMWTVGAEATRPDASAEPPLDADAPALSDDALVCQAPPTRSKAAAPIAPAEVSERISSVLRAQIASAGSADAAIFLSIPGWSSREGLRAEVAKAQDEVLAPFGHFMPRGLYRFSMVPALAARLTAWELAVLESSPRVVAVGPNLPASAAMSQSVPLVGGDKAHRVGLTGNGVTVAVLDTGIDSDDPDLAGALVGEHCFCQGSVLGDGVGCCTNGLEERLLLPRESAERMPGGGGVAGCEVVGRATCRTAVPLSHGGRELVRSAGGWSSPSGERTRWRWERVVSRRLFPARVEASGSALKLYWKRWTPHLLSLDRKHAV